MMMVDEVLPRNRKKLPLAEAFATSFNLVDIRALKPELIHCARRVKGRKFTDIVGVLIDLVVSNEITA